MVVDTTARVWIFTLVVTATTLMSAVILNFVFFPRELLPLSLKATAGVVLIVSFPICLWVARQMHEKAILSQELQDLVNRDRLTDVATRDFFFARLTEFPDAYGVSLMIDIDHFKRVNDTHGHLAGDDVIHAVAQIMRGQIRDVDIVCRFGVRNSWSSYTAPPPTKAGSSQNGSAKEYRLRPPGRPQAMCG